MNAPALSLIAIPIGSFADAQTTESGSLLVVGIVRVRVRVVVRVRMGGSTSIPSAAFSTGVMSILITASLSLRTSTHSSSLALGGVDLLVRT